MKRPSLSIGIEEEYQTIDPETRDLRSHIQMEILDKAKLKVAERVKPEMHQAVVEVGTKVCRDIKEAREDMRNLRREMITLAEQNGLLLGAASTHPFADWKVQEIYPDERYRQVVEDMQLVARANLVFGLHVHVGIEDRDTAIHIMNSLRYFLPHILALSTNSPFWMGMETGFKSYRCKVFERFPRTGIPDVFANWADYETFINLLVRTNCIDNGKKIWWDIRPHPFFETIDERRSRMGLEIHQFICLEDNFGLLVRDEASGAAASIDAPDGEAIRREAERLGWRLTHALLTHHHLDHVQGVPALRAAFPGLLVVGARKDAARLDGLDIAVGEGDEVAIGELAGAGDRNPRPHHGTSRLLFRRGRNRVRRRHAVFAGLRADLRGNGRDDVRFAGEAGRTAGRDPRLLRP